ncbi:MAG TPA: alkaline phosphatase D family protein [Nocardioidaceae bacterium]|nr:alkaline phosphatase D family protein [Nocardioidaceae bacterium]
MTDDLLVLGPLLRYVDETSAAIWVEVAGRGTVTVTLQPSAGDAVSGHTFSAHTFTVHGHHYALVEVDGLAPGSSTEYTVRFDDNVVWPPPRSTYPPSRIRTLAPGRRCRLMFGSCRTSVPHDAEHNRTHGIDVLRAYALAMRDVDESEWPDLVLFLGDQVYADETSDEMQAFIDARRDIEQPPYKELKDYEEYAHLYRLAWTEPANRWLLSTLPIAMIFDDHDVRDDWNTSRAWRDEIRRSSWWHDRVVGALASYWVYQHLGNLGPADRAGDDLWAEVRRLGREGDAGKLLDEFADRSDDDPAYARWSYHRDLAGSRLVVLDTRSARMLDEGDRRMLDEAEMTWFESLASGGVDHLLIASSVPYMLPMGLHHLEAWSEGVAAGSWGPRAARWAEILRQGVDLEHWAAFQKSFQRVAQLTLAVARGERGPAPATVTFLGGDVHHSYLAEAHTGRRRRGFSRGRGRGYSRGSEQSRVLQVVCSPIRNPLPRVIRFASAAAAYGLAWPMGRLAARSASVVDPPFRWSMTDGPWFDNAIALLDLDGRRGRVSWLTADFRDDEPEPSSALIRSATLR